MSKPRSKVLRVLEREMLRELEQSCRADIKFARGYPLDGTREAQLRWLRRRGHTVKKATVQVLD